MTEDDFDLKCTCGACPEQYDVYYKGRLVGYMRYRWGYFYCCPYDEDENLGDEIYNWQSNDGYSGILGEERDQVINEALDALAKYYNEKQKP